MHFLRVYCYIPNRFVAFVRTRFAFVGLILLTACGGGGGGGSSDGGTGGGGNGGGGGGGSGPSPHDGQTYPEIQPDSPSFGNPVGRAANQYTIEIDGEEFTLDPEFSSGLYTQMEPARSTTPNPDDGSVRVFYGHALENSSVLVIGGVIDTAPLDAIPAFGVDGVVAPPRTQGVALFTGQYIAIGIDGQMIGDWPIELYLNADDLTRSYGADLITGDQVVIRFSSQSETTLHGTISDPTHDYHNATFGFFGPDSETIAGGYNDGYGVGLLLVSTQ